MRNFKRFLAMALTMLMIVGSFSLLTSAKFEDVTDFQDEISILSELGVIKGKADGTFGFDELVTRRQAALFMARSATGKVDDAVNWQSKINNTPFTDLDPENDFYGAISYCHGNGIVVGRTKTTFDPNGNIKFKDALTMAVRALGYKTDAMDAGYPYTYYSKAISLGLDKGIEDISLETEATRGVMAKLLYNMLFATNSKGTTMASDSFGTAVKATNLVLAAVPGKKLVANFNPLPSDTSVVALIEFNADGTLNYNKAYNFKWADFAALAYGEGTEEKAIDHVGDSYYVVTINGFKSLVSVTENPSKTFTQDEAPGNGKIDGADYSLVQTWSSVFNIGTTNTGKDELIQYNTAYAAGGKIGHHLAYYGNYWYVVDVNDNILDDNGDKLLIYYENIVDKDDIVSGATEYFPFYYKIGTQYYPAYLPMDGSRYAGAATTDKFSDKPATYHSNMNGSAYTTNVNAYADTVAYDDNNDGVYDRAYFTNYIFGKYYTTDNNGDGNLEHHFTLGANGADVHVVNTSVEAFVLNNLSGKELKSGAYVLWARDAINRSFTVKKIYDDVKAGYVTGVDVINKTITFSNVSTFGLGVGTTETIKYGVAKLPGATNTNDNLTINDDGTGSNSTESLIGVHYSLIHKYVSYIVDDEHDGKVVAIFDNVNATTPLVITDIDFTSLLTFGNIRAYVIDQTGTAQIITISNINGVPLVNYNVGGALWYPGLGFGYDTINDALKAVLIDDDSQFPGLVYGAKQTNGTWVISTALNDDNIYKAGGEGQTQTKLSFYNGIAYQNYDLESTNETIPGLKFSAVGSSLVIIMREVDNDDNFFTGRYLIATGIPSNGAHLYIDSGADIYAKAGYMYIPEGKEADFGTAHWGWNLTSAYTTGLANDVIYLDELALIGASGFTYTYTGIYYSILTGKTNADIGAYITSTEMLAKDTFYEVTRSVQDGMVVINAVRELDDDDFETVYITAFSDNHVEYVDNGDNEYYRVGKSVAVYDWSDTNLKKLTPATGVCYEAMMYVGNVYSNTRVFLVTDLEYEEPVEPVPVVEYTLTLKTIELHEDTGGFWWLPGEFRCIVGYEATKNGEAVKLDPDDITFKIRYKSGIEYSPYIYDGDGNIEDVDEDSFTIKNITTDIDGVDVALETDFDFLIVVTAKLGDVTDTIIDIWNA
jgi:hypothetical protein